MDRVRIETYDGDWETLRGEWNDLLTRAEPNSVFLEWDWQSAWWSCFSQDLQRRMLLARDPKGLLLGVAPMKIRRRKGLRFLEWIGFGPPVFPDYLDCVVDAEHGTPVREAIVRACLREMSRDWDVMYLSDLRERQSSTEPSKPTDPGLIPPPATSPTLEVFTRVAATTGAPVWRRRGEECPYSLLCGDYDGAFLGRRKSKFRHNARNYRNKLNKDHTILIEKCTRADQVDSFFSDLGDLHSRMLTSRGHTSSYGNPAYFKFQKSVAQSLAGSRRLQLVRMKADGRSIVVMLGFVQDRTCYFYSVGYDPDAMTAYLVAIGYFIEALIADGVEVLDWLRGAHEYKSRWCDGSTLTAHLVIGAPHLRGRSFARMLRWYCSWQDRKGKPPPVVGSREPRRP